MLTLDERSLFRDLQREQDNIVIAALEGMLAQGILADPESGRRALQQQLTPVVVNASHVSAATGSAMYQASRRNALGSAAGAFVANPLVRAGLEVAVASTIAWGVDRMLSSDDPDAGLSDMKGGLTRHVRSGAHTTMQEAVGSDPEQPRYRRVPRAGGCSWCLMLASRGYVYQSKTTALVASGERGDQPGGDEFHDWCNCTSEPQFRNEDPPEWVQFLEAEWRRLNWVNGEPAYDPAVARANWHNHVRMGGLGDRPKPRPVGRPALSTLDDPE